MLEMCTSLYCKYDARDLQVVTQATDASRQPFTTAIVWQSSPFFPTHSFESFPCVRFGNAQPGSTSPPGCKLRSDSRVRPGSVPLILGLWRHFMVERHPPFPLTIITQVGLSNMALRSVSWTLARKPLRRYNPPVVEGQHAAPIERPLPIPNVLFDALDLICNWMVVVAHAVSQHECPVHVHPCHRSQSTLQTHIV